MVRSLTHIAARCQVVEHQVILRCDECEQEWVSGDTLAEAKAQALSEDWVLTQRSHLCAYCYDQAHP